MKRRALSGRVKALALTIILAIAMHAVFLHPLPLHVRSCIPSSLHADSSEPVELMPGDSLQLLYHFELVHQFFSGESPPFRNLWEFNLSDAPPPVRFDLFYAPFSVPYAVLRMVGAPDAFAWNAVQLFSVWLGLLFCFFLVRRCGVPDGGALFVAVLAQCIPYRWMTLAEGSPTGFGMGLLPGFVLGVDMAVRDRSWKGGLLAGMLLPCLYAADLHCALFALLSLPFWCFFFVLPAPTGLRKEGIRPLVQSLSWLLAGVLAVVLCGLAGRLSYAGTNVEGGRTFEEVAVHSPEWQALFHFRWPAPMQGQLYMGCVLPVLFAAACAVLACRWRKCPRVACAGLLLGGAALFSVALALGANGPFGGLAARALRAVVPPFRMVRQPIKVLCLFPVVFALAGGGALACVRFGWRRRLFSVIAASLLALGAFGSVRFGMTTGLIRLTGANAAYDAAVRAAEMEGKTARAIVLPISPGDTPYASLYQYWAQRSHLRMLDGYAAVSSREYEERIWKRFRSMEGGGMSDSQYRGLLDLGVTAVLIDGNILVFAKRSVPLEDRVARMLKNPRLRFLASDRGVWAFALVPDSAPPSPEEPNP